MERYLLLLQGNLNTISGATHQISHLHQINLGTLAGRWRAISQRE
jgi:hypothetical protein